MNLLNGKKCMKGIFTERLKSEIERIWNEGKNVIFDVDVKGGIESEKIFRRQGARCFR